MTANYQPLGTRMPHVLRALSIAAAVAAALLSGCAADRPMRTPDVGSAIKTELAPAPTAKAVPAVVSESLAEPAAAPVAPTEPRIDLLINNAQARDVFLAIVADTRYSMLMHPDVKGSLSVTLRGVTVKEALDAIRDVYGYDYKMEGRRITVYPPTLQTRIFRVNYPTSQRAGSSDLSVSPGRASSATDSANTANGQTPGAAGTSGNAAGASNSSYANATSRISTRLSSDVWAEVTAALEAIVGKAEGRSLVFSPHAGIIAVRAMPDELRQVENFLKAMQLSIERQVMLEAKIVQVELRDSFQSGIDWSGLTTSGKSSVGLGSIGGGTRNNILIDGVKTGLPGFPSGSTTGSVNALNLPNAGGGLFGVALASDGFQAVLGFLETQGDVQTLSSPRVATLSNQKAVLKVGSDDYYVTGVTGGSSTAASATTAAATTMPTVTLSPFFSGISLDVTPQIDDGNMVTLHVHPSISTVSERSVSVGIGSLGSYSLPVASTAVNETDTMVRILDGQIVAIGGLMELASSRNNAGLPGTTDKAFSWLFGNKASSGRKREVVVLIKPSIIRTGQDWEAQTNRARAALEDMGTERARVIELHGEPVAPAGATGQ